MSFLHNLPSLRPIACPLPNVDTQGSGAAWEWKIFATSPRNPVRKGPRAFGTAHELPPSAMDMRDLETTLEAALAVTRPSPRNVRDALVDYYAVVARPFIEKGLSHTHPNADEAVIRRLLMLRLGTLWNDLESSWDNPSLDDLRVFRDRIERYACVREDERLLKSQRLIDDLMLAASVGERLRAAKAGKIAPKLQVIQGGGEVTEPRGQLRLVRSETG